MPDKDLEPARIRKLNTAHGALQNAGADLTQPSFSMFAIKSGADAFMNSLLSSGPALAALIATIPGARFVDKRAGRKHGITLAFMAASRAFYLLLALVPFLPQGSRVPVFVALVALMNLPGSIANTAWQSYMADIVPEGSRPAVFASRSRAMNMVGTAVVLGAGAFLDASPLPLGFQICFSLAFLVAGAELAVFARMKGPAKPGSGAAPHTDAPRTAGSPRDVTVPEAQVPPGASTRAARRSPLAALRGQAALLRSEPEFLKYLAASVAFYFAWQTPWSLFSMYTIDRLHANNLWNSVLTVVNMGGSIVGFGFWARVAERKGNLHVITRSALPLIAVPFVYALAAELWPIAAMNLVVGLTLSGLVVALFNAMLERTPPGQRTTFIAYYNTATMLTAFVAPFWGVALLGMLGYQGAFAVCALQRLAGTAAMLALLRAGRRRGS